MLIFLFYWLINVVVFLIICVGFRKKEGVNVVGLRLGWVIDFGWEYGVDVSWCLFVWLFMFMFMFVFIMIIMDDIKFSVYSSVFFVFLFVFVLI